MAKGNAGKEVPALAAQFNEDRSLHDTLRAVATTLYNFYGGDHWFIVRFSLSSDGLTSAHLYAQPIPMNQGARLNDFDGQHLREAGLGFLYDYLLTGRVYVASAPDIPTDHNQYVFADDQQKVLLFPLLTEERVWGFIGLQDLSGAAQFDLSTRNDLMDAVQAVRNALIERLRALNEARLRAVDEQIDAILSRDEPADARIDALLLLGLDELQLDIGIASHIKDDTYTVVNHGPAESGLQRGQTFPLGQTYCSITLLAGYTVAIPHMYFSAHNRHPAYAAFQLESYIGVMTKVQGERYGTVNFSSPTPRQEVFSKTERAIVERIGRAVETLL